MKNLQRQQKLTRNSGDVADKGTKLCTFIH